MEIATTTRSSTFAPEMLISARSVSSIERALVGSLRNKPPYADGTIEELIQDYEPISLEETNKKSRMLKRVDNKYVLRRDELRKILDGLQDDFAVLEIDGVKEFTYSSCYFDDNFTSYYEHHQGKRLRFKIRQRHYVDSGELYFEVKLKDKRGQTNKERIRCDVFRSPHPDEKCLEMLKAFYRRLYKKEFKLDVSPALIVNCKRCTLVSLAGGERITIDYCLNFDSMTGSNVSIGNDFIIVETKSADGKGKADVLLKKNGIRQAKKLSKYCLGAALTGRVTKYNYFRPNLKRMMENVVDYQNGSPAYHEVSVGG